MSEGLYKSNRTVALGKIEQFSYTEKAKARKTMNLLVIPDSLIADASSATLVKKGSLLRVKGTDGGFITFGNASVAVPSILTENTLETPVGFFFIIATDDFVRTSAAMRIEVCVD